MKQQNPIVTIKKPCHENWENMAPAQQGRFCKGCSKVVVDFTEMGDDAIIKFLKQSDSNLCGSFYNDQLNREMQLSPEVKPASFFYKAAASLLLFAGIESAEGHTINPPTEISFTDQGEYNRNIGEQDQEHFTPPSDCVDSSSVSLTVRDKKGQGIKCFVNFDDAELEFESDENGGIKAMLPDSMVKDTMVFTVSARGYKSATFTVTRKEIPLRKEIVLRELTKAEKKKIRYRIMGCPSF